ncbi:hypothetical protein DAPPUDRAFT_304272 [Daphnia pulex]|uniref:Sm domain-containing protein n=1 Tax=Daphnia pulex TaxID=6669 RepID=E9GKQ5_DAPPU|nr:hypothetical protein DAPPUDRAFT_304272 [Daphnia pulex]|eukprot:EFX79721.1 hypothetical protein DAPPUDRAFT_304272 [Daphnia pulex]
MTSLSTARDRYNAANSLLCLLQALEGRVAVVELRNEMAVKGLISQVDGFMNVSLQNATVQGNDDQHYHFEEFFVKARNIRYVQIPEDIDITEAIKNQLEGKPKAHKTDMSSTTKAKLARKRQKETLKFIQQQQQAEKNEIEPQPPGTSQETDE